MTKFSKVNMILLAMVLSMLSMPAFAQNFGNAAEGVFVQLTSFADVITGVAFVAGLGLGLAAAFKFKAHSDNPQQVSIKVPIMYAIVAAICIGLPAFLNMGRVSLFADGESNNMEEGVYNSIG